MAEGGRLTCVDVLSIARAPSSTKGVGRCTVTAYLYTALLLLLGYIRCIISYTRVPEVVVYSVREVSDGFS